MAFRIVFNELNDQSLVVFDLEFNVRTMNFPHISECLVTDLSFAIIVAKVSINGFDGLVGAQQDSGLAIGVLSVLFSKISDEFDDCFALFSVDGVIVDGIDLILVLSRLYTICEVPLLQVSPLRFLYCVNEEKQFLTDGSTPP